jgi:dihydroorotase
MFDLLIRSGTVLTDEGPVAADVGITDGEVTAIGPDLGDAERTVDASGAWVGPGFVDLHTHLREPGEEWKEDIATGSAAAAAGGYTAITAMPNTTPAIDAGHLARFVADRGREVGLVDVIPAGCLTMGRGGATMAHIDELWDAGVRMFTDDGDALADASVLRLVMEYVAQLGGVVSQHAVDPSLSRSGYMHEGAVSSRLGMYGIPSEADDIVIARDITLARLTGVRYHVQHVSTLGGVAQIAAAKRDGLDITAEVTPHHLMFTHEDVAGTDPNFKMMPPLRSSADRDALVAGLVDGTIDAVATDHAPHAALEKEVPFEHAPNGVLGLEWSGAVVTTLTGLSMEAFFDRMSVTPARVLGRSDHGVPVGVGRVANLVVYRPEETWIPDTTRSRSRNSPYLGRELTGRVAMTLLRGAVTWEVP